MRNGTSEPIQAERRLSSPAHVFANRDELLLARNAWCANSTAATAVFGGIGTWDVSRVTSLAYLFCTYSNLGCNPACANFNDAIGTWDTSSVTSLEVRRAPLPTVLVWLWAWWRVAVRRRRGGGGCSRLVATRHTR